MKWRTRFAVLLAFLLSAPLMWSLNRLLVGELKVPVASGDASRLVPILSPDETSRLLTFARSCEGNEDCEAPLVCLRELKWKRACVASTCATDADCSGGLSCYSVAVGERVVRMCGAPGEVAEGAFCTELPRERNWACAPGLVCTHMSCRRPCQPQGSQGCPAGYFCSAADVKGHVCLPTCEGRACAEGERCVALDHGVSVCARVHGSDCQLNPCPVGQVCGVSAGKMQGQVWMKCELPCSKQAPSCPEGFSCIGETCRQRCRADEPGSCGPLETCAGASERSLGVCIFDFNK
ncbi:hypothetical protein ATI61_103387 [Archangium gephyra]|uniref:Uncharacterized protein n=1 Tax=Archangium gephyra TaxID=48 RepID=A0ABX9K6P6_9BACT|nr:hypothetical protein ATI61_103387 [Archangium gephyra]